jgi:hypothetical protein
MAQPERDLTMRRIIGAAALIGMLTASCKNLEVSDLNAPSLSDLETGATRSGIAAAVQGLIAETRTNAGGLVSTYGSFGREGYNLDPSNPQNAANVYVSLDQDINVGWVTAYRTLKQGNTVMTSVDGVAGVTAAEREGVKGFVKTLEAMALLQLIMGNDVSGAAVDVAAKTNDPLPPVVGRTQVYQRIVSLLDEAVTHLNAAGAAFSFQLPPGFTGFSTPQTFLKFNKALRARANVYTKNFTGALTDLGLSFVDATGATPLTAGVYWDYSTQAGDAVNPVYDPTTRQRFAHPSFLANAKLKSGGAKDNRALTKVAAIDTVVRNAFTVTEKLTVYTTSAAPIPIIRNEELVLLRAEANLACAGVSPALNCSASVPAQTAALADLNVTRQTSGGLPAIALGTWLALTEAQRLDTLLYEKRYSLFWEFGTTWIDARNYGKLALLPKDRPGDVVFPYFMIPTTECNQRTASPPAGCTQRPPGL